MRAALVLCVVGVTLGLGGGGCSGFQQQVKEDGSKVLERCSREATIAIARCTARVLREETCRTALAERTKIPSYCAALGLAGDPAPPATQPAR